jgi:hypothetical protein
VTNQTVFGDLRRDAKVVYRVKTQASTYIIGVHEDGGRRFVVVRGEPNTDRENVVLRDTEPRIGDQLLFDVPHAEWPGRTLQIATMTSSTIIEAAIENDPASVAMVSAGFVPYKPGHRVEAPEGMSETPAIAQVPGKGTMPGASAEFAQAAHAAAQAPAKLARDVVVAAHRPELPYPQRHVRHAEDAAALLRSVARRDRIFEDAAFSRDRQLLERLRRALDECARLTEQIRTRDR